MHTNEKSYSTIIQTDVDPFGYLDITCLRTASMYCFPKAYRSAAILIDANARFRNKGEELWIIFWTSPESRANLIYFRFCWLYLSHSPQTDSPALKSRSDLDQVESSSIKIGI